MSEKKGINTTELTLLIVDQQLVREYLELPVI